MLIVRKQLLPIAFTLSRVVSDEAKLRQLLPSDPNYQVIVGSVASRGSSSGPALVWTQAAASATWVIPHNLGYHPQVSIRLNNGEVISTDVTHLDVNTCSLQFHAAVSGFADLR